VTPVPGVAAVLCPQIFSVPAVGNIRTHLCPDGIRFFISRQFAHYLCSMVYHITSGTFLLSLLAFQHTRGGEKISANKQK